jgi:hypothetical protein
MPRSWPKSIPSPPDGRRTAFAGGDRFDFRPRQRADFGYATDRAVVVVEGATVRPILTETTTMIILAILGSLATIGVLCWLLFTLAVFALPALAGVSAGHLAHETGAGVLGAIVIGIVAAGATLGIGQLLLIVLRPMWLKFLVAVAFVAPAAIAGYHATHGIVKHTMPSETWQIVFSVIGAVAVGITAFVRMTAMAAPGPSGQGTATA